MSTRLYPDCIRLSRAHPSNAPSRSCRAAGGSYMDPYRLIEPHMCQQYDALRFLSISTKYVSRDH